MPETIAGKNIHIKKAGTGTPYIYWGVQQNSEEYVENVFTFLQQHVENLSATLIACEADDWNAEFSPWQAPAIFTRGENDSGFAGKGTETLTWLKEHCIPYVEAETGDLFTGRAQRYLAGYSLAGLFSLWAFYESRLFRGCASGSGSLWFPGWAEYFAQASAEADSRIYLSLGGKEEKTKNPIMATIGDATRNVKKQMENDPGITYSKLEWNPGGHFSDPDIRMAKGMAWLLEKHVI